MRSKVKASAVESSDTAPTPAPVMTNAQRPAVTIQYLDRTDIREIFADSITGLIFDGQMLRMEFAVTRFDEVTANTPISGRRYPACRVVLPQPAAVELINRMQQITAALMQAGVIKTNSALAPSDTKIP